MATTKAASPKQKEVLDALNGGRKVTVTTDDKGKKKVSLTTAKGSPVKDAPKLDRAAVEAVIKNGWVDATGTITDSGKAAKKPAKAAAKK